MPREFISSHRVLNSHYVSDWVNTNITMRGFIAITLGAYRGKSQGVAFTNLKQSEVRIVVSSQKDESIMSGSESRGHPFFIRDCLPSFPGRSVLYLLPQLFPAIAFLEVEH